MCSYIKLDNFFNPDMLKVSLDSICSKIYYEDNQISLQHREGIESWNDGTGSLWYEDVKSDIEYNTFYENIKNEYIVKCLESLPFKVYRTRIMLMKPKTCYSMHEDKAIRFQIPVDTADDQGRFIFDHGEVIKQEEGFTYILNTKKAHTAVNCSKKLDRIHIVGCLEEKDETDNSFLREVYDRFKI